MAELLEHSGDRGGQLVRNLQQPPVQDAAVAACVYLDRSRAGVVPRPSTQDALLPAPRPVAGERPADDRTPSRRALADLQAVDDEHRLGDRLERRDAPRQLLRRPDVVLIAPRDQIAAAQPGRLHEVRTEPEVRLVADDPDLKWRLGGEPLQQCNGVVARVVVTDDELNGKAGLRGEAGELGSRNAAPL